MIRTVVNCVLVGLLAVCLAWPMVWGRASTNRALPRDRQLVVFWHFWGGAERAVVDRVVERFNDSQQIHYVKAVAMPGNNLDLKLFLSVAGGEPPDLVNLDDPVLADWAECEAIMPLDQIVPAALRVELHRWLFPAARELTMYRGRCYGLCNGLDVRALYYNQTALDLRQLAAPKTLDELDQIADSFRLDRSLAPMESLVRPSLGFLPNARNLWAWGIVFGGRFYDPTNDCVTLESPQIADAMAWMASYGQRDGQLAISLRARGQSLPGKTFPLLTGRYACVVDGQWRVRDIERFQARRNSAGQPGVEFGVCPLPSPDGVTADAGWINGNFFVVPAKADNAAGAWEFMKFWSGFDGNEPQAAETCVAGGWIPVSQEVVNQPVFQAHLQRVPLFAEFVRLAGSPQQVPRPNVPGAQRFDREVRQLAEQVMNPSHHGSIQEMLQETQRRMQRHIDSHRERRL